MMKLYGFPPSPNTWKVRAVAAHLRTPLELEFVDLAKGGSHTPAYLALNPTGRTPVLVDGDFRLQGLPGGARLGHVRSRLLAGVRRFF